MRDSQYKSCAVQNQFTAYLIAAIRNYKRTYLRRISTALRTELPMEGHSEVMELCEETDFFCGLPLMQRLENERLFAAMQGLSERERYIFLSKVLGEMSLSEIALSLGITYGAAAMSYWHDYLSSGCPWQSDTSQMWYFCCAVWRPTDYPTISCQIRPCR